MDKNNDKKNGCYDKPIKGIQCSVQNCKYHERNDDCCAPHISVGPSSAASSGETNCTTFQPKGE